MLETRNDENQKLYRFNAFDNYIEFGCFTDQFLTGMDRYGEPDDIISFNECIDCDLYENIRRLENLKHALNSEYLKHLSIIKDIFKDNIQIQKDLGLYGVINFDLDAWLEHVKIFYVTILSNNHIFDLIAEYGICLEDIESAVEMMLQLEEFMIDNKKEKQNEIWN